MKHVVKLLVLVSVLIFATSAEAFVADRIPCLQDLELHFFNEATVNEALSIYFIPQGLWTPINRDLRYYSSEVPNRMKKISSRLVPNPLEYPLNNLEAARILRQALYDVFVKVLRHYYITEHPTIEEIFNYVFVKEAPRLIRCLGEEVKILIPEIE